MTSVVAAALLSFAQPKTLNVYAAASLREPFTAISREFESVNPGVRVRLNFAGSQTLAAQIKQGAPADVFASAAAKNLNDTAFDRPTMRVFAKNKLEVAVRKGLRNIRTLEQVAGLRNLVIADLRVPVGKYTEAFLNKAGVAFGSLWLRSFKYHLVSREQDVKAVLAKVLLGEADAGVVYASDIISAKGQVLGIKIPEKLNQVAEYPIAVLTFAEDKDDAKKFVDYVCMLESQRILERSGFASPYKWRRMRWEPQLGSWVNWLRRIEIR